MVRLKDAETLRFKMRYHLFQFLMVRLKEGCRRDTELYIFISIPYGAIKRHWIYQT